jgi:hypothetical protein
MHEQFLDWQAKPSCDDDAGLGVDTRAKRISQTRALANRADMHQLLHARVPQSLVSTARAYLLSSAAIVSRSLICWMSTVVESVGRADGFGFEVFLEVFGAVAEPALLCATKRARDAETGLPRIVTLPVRIRFSPRFKGPGLLFQRFGVESRLGIFRLTVIEGDIDTLETFGALSFCLPGIGLAVTTGQIDIVGEGSQQGTWV